MNMDALNIIVPIITLLLGGGATWLFTIKYTRRQAEASAMEHFQTVYQGLIKDLQEDRATLRNERDALADVVKNMEQRVKDLEHKVDNNAKILRQLSKFAAEKAPSCGGCVLIELISNSQI